MGDDITGSLEEQVKILQNAGSAFENHARCAGCTTPILLQRNIEQRITSTNEAFCLLCEVCTTVTCGGCGEGCPPSSIPHCEPGRLFSIWMILRLFDAQLIHNENEKAKKLATRKPAVDKNLQGNSKRGIGYGVYGESNAPAPWMLHDDEDDKSAPMSTGSSESDDDLGLPPFDPKKALWNPAGPQKASWNQGVTWQPSTDDKSPSGSLSPEFMAPLSPVVETSLPQNPLPGSLDALSGSGYTEDKTKSGSLSPESMAPLSPVVKTSLPQNPLPGSLYMMPASEYVTLGAPSAGFTTMEKRAKKEPAVTEDLSYYLAEAKADLKLAKTLEELISLFSRPVTPDTEDLPLPELVFLRFSQLLNHLVAYIKNDDIVNCAERERLYRAIFLFIDKLAKDHRLASAVTEPLLAMKRSAGLGLESMEINDEKTSPSILHHLANTYQQAKAYLATSKSSTEDSCFGMCELIIQVSEELGKCYRPQPTTSTPETPEANSKAWSKYCQEHRISQTDEVLRDHKHSKEFGSEDSGSLGRMRRIAKELAVLTTSLPDGIFLKVAESRSDVMKVLMVGVEGTPYAGGLFTFDLFLPLSYPYTPPKMLFTLPGVEDYNDRTEGRMNPNLHAGSGTVCISLLNTWQGEPGTMWQPGKSTLLAVLVSVQAFILGSPSPYANEPGLEHVPETAPQAVKYNNAIEKKVVLRGMVAWLEKLHGKHEHLWSDIMSVYWKQHGSSILTQVLARQNINKTLCKPRRELQAWLAKLDIVGSPKRKRDSGEDIEMIWRYTGDMGMASLREACKEFGIQAARSIRQTVERLEDAVNEEELWDSERALKWGCATPIA